MLVAICHLPTQLEDVSVSTIPGALSALEALCDYALYKSTFTLHYNLILSRTYPEHIAKMIEIQYTVVLD